MTDWKAQARELAIWIQVIDIGVCQDPDCKECKFVVDEVAAALERAAAAERADIQKLCVALAPFALDFSQDLTGDEERLLNSQKWGRHCKRAFVALRAIRARIRPS